MKPHHLPAFRPLNGVFEPSAIQQLPDGRFLVVEDEKEFPFSLLSLDTDGNLSSTPLLAASADASAPFEKLADLEGVTLDGAGFIYATTSHSRNTDGEEKKSRDKLVRFRIEGNHAVAPLVVSGLKPALVAAHLSLAQAAAIREVKTAGGLNIEALEFSPEQTLLIGFRSPLLDNNAIIACLENPAAMFDSDEAPRVSPSLVTLNLEGNGIRGMSYVPGLGGYLIISGPVSSESVHFQLWFWRGQPGDQARRVTVDGLPGFAHAEGICPAIIGGQPWIVVVSDDGSREEDRCAGYLLLAPEQLQIAA
jgi:hypothetical protein